MLWQYILQAHTKSIYDWIQKDKTDSLKIDFTF